MAHVSDKHLTAAMVLIALIMMGIFFFWPTLSASKPVELSPNEQFASCLSQKGVVMYGVDTCVRCLEQKNMFGKAFEQIQYVNCDFDSKSCAEKGIQKYYPVWTMGSNVLLGVQAFSNLSKLSGCPYVSSST